MFFSSLSLVLNCTTEVTSGTYQRQGMGQTLPPLTTTMLPVIPVNSSVPTNTVVGQQVHISVHGNWNYAPGKQKLSSNLHIHSGLLCLVQADPKNYAKKIYAKL